MEKKKYNRILDIIKVQNNMSALGKQMGMKEAEDHWESISLKKAETHWMPAEDMGNEEITRILIKYSDQIKIDKCL